jgi:hypothetical protein
MDAMKPDGMTRNAEFVKAYFEENGKVQVEDRVHVQVQVE